MLCPSLVPLVPKLLFGNAGLGNSVSPTDGGLSPLAGCETEFRKTPVPKREFGNEKNEKNNTRPQNEFGEKKNEKRSESSLDLIGVPMSAATSLPTLTAKDLASD